MPGCARHQDVCGRCDAPLDFDFTMPFQSLVDIDERRIYGYEVLVRGPKGEPAVSVLARIDDRTRYRFDQACRVKTIEIAHRVDAPERTVDQFSSRCRLRTRNLYPDDAGSCRARR